MSRFRVGQGFDVHRFRVGRDLQLCGVVVPSKVGLEGHSDGDVALHAVVDALLGAVSEADIGEHFPPTDEQWRDADSRDFVRKAMEIVREHGFEVVNCDLTIIGERPRIGPHRGTLKASLAGMLGVAVPEVSVKATTTEGLGFTGRGEGLAALAVVLLTETTPDNG
jgi:2-C-methyl-D-erythritol 2,4-cyclodiphosphate synthase